MRYLHIIQSLYAKSLTPQTSSTLFSLSVSPPHRPGPSTNHLIASYLFFIPFLLHFLIREDTVLSELPMFLHVLVQDLELLSRGVIISKIVLPYPVKELIASTTASP